MIPTRPLGASGDSLPILGLGGAAIGQQYGPVSPNEVVAMVRYAYEAGVHFLDTSAYYGEGLSELLLGQALKTLGHPAEITLCTKVGRLARNHFDFSAPGLRTTLQASLRRLQVDHVDILLAHDIEFAADPQQILYETLPALIQFRQEGFCRRIGMSGLPLSCLQSVIETGQLDLVMSYCHYTLLDDSLLTDLIPIAEKFGVGVVNASPLAMGLLAPQGPPDWHPAPEALRLACREAHPWAAEQGFSLTDLALQFCLAEPRICSTVTGAASLEQLKHNVALLQFPADPSHLAEIRARFQSVHRMTWPSGHVPS